MLKLNVISTDSDKESDGVWVSYPFNDEIKFKIARSNNAKIRKFAKTVSRAKWKRLQDNEEGMKKFDTEIMAQYILVGWEGLRHNDGTDFPYTISNAIDFLSDPQYHDIRDWIAAQSEDLSHFENLENDEGIEELKKSTDGDS